MQKYEKLEKIGEGKFKFRFIYVVNIFVSILAMLT